MVSMHIGFGCMVRSAGRGDESALVLFFDMYPDPPNQPTWKAMV